jgi:cyclic pyranopterin phosphate synthase
MAEPQRVIPLVDEAQGLPWPIASPPAAGAELRDQRQRPLRDLRISVTDRCNFRCGYCMPKEVFDKQHRFLPQPELLSFEEITRVAGVFVGLGVKKLRITGGEPLLRKHLERLIEQLAALRTPEGRPPDLTLTTNATLLARQARSLRAAGLQRVTVSLDALSEATFQRMNDVGFPVAEVLAGIDEALAAGFESIKVNMVVQKGTNDHEIVPMARHFREAYGGRIVLRFIEYMDVGSHNGWRMDEVLPSDEVRARVQALWPLEPLPPSAPGETAQRWRYADGGGELGFISSVTQAFCGDCNRARLSTDGKLYTCLFASRGHDVRALLRGAADDAQIAAAVAAVWAQRSDRYSELRGQFMAGGERPPPGARKVEMHYIGG